MGNRGDNYHMYLPGVDKIYKAHAGDSSYVNVQL